jgi:N-acetylglucosamine kinase-like BadF-type ATPase
LWCPRRRWLITGQQIIVGADIGGSKAALVFVDARGARAELVVPSAAWHRQGEGGIARSVAELILAEAGRRGLTRSGGDGALDAERFVVAVGAHGSDTVSQCERLQREIEALLPADVLALNDAELLLPAAGRHPGVGLVSGTGSIVIGYGPDDELISVGGWGGYLSDQGSAIGLFLDAARMLVRARDRGEPPDPMERVMLELCELGELRELPAALGDMGSPTSWAHLVPVLYERSFALGSRFAEEVVEQSGEVMAGLVALLGRRGCDTSTVVAGGGMIANASWLQDALRASLARECPASELVILTSPPVEGAVTLAAALAGALAEPPATLRDLHPALRRRLAAPPEITPATGVPEP